MDTFDGDINLFDPRNIFAGDEKMPVEFYMGTVPALEEESLAAGHPVFKDAEFIRIFNSKDNIIDRPIRDTDKARWPRKYAAWKATGVDTPGGAGWRLEAWPQMTRAQVEEFKYFKIFTVEQLAEMPDSIGQRIMGFPTLKSKAKAAVQLAKDEAPLLQMQAALEKRDGQIAELSNEVRRLTALVKEVMEKKAA